jgi:MGT family glycosyltransferase
VDLLFVNMPAHGHINPTLPVVEELLRRGHRVRYATGADVLDKVRASGAEAWEIPLRALRPPRLDEGFDPEQMVPQFNQMLDDMQASLPMLEEQLAGDPPDAVCADVMTLLGRIVAEKLDLPHVSLVPNFASNEQFSMREEFPAHNTSFDPNHPVFLRFAERMREFAAEQGVQIPMPGAANAQPAPLNVVFLPREFQLRADTFDGRFVFVGPCLGSRERREQWEPADPDRPVLFVSLGTVFHDRLEFYRMCLEAFGDSPWQVAMSVGSEVDPADLGPLPENFEVRRHFPQTAVLRKARAFLSHTGMNSTMESLFYGVPLIAVPQMPEQSMNARRVEELGAGRGLDSAKLDASLLRNAVDEVAADESIRANVEALQRGIRSCGGPAAAAEAIEKHLSVH